MKTNKILSIAMAGTFAILTSCEDNAGNEMPNKVGETKTSSGKVAPPPAKSTVDNYTFTGKESEPIALETAKTWTANYRQKNPGQREGHFFGHEIIEQILAEKGAVGIRIYYALDEKGEKQLLLVGTDKNGENLLPSSLKLNSARAAGENIVADMSYPCPSMCAPPTTSL
jgi:hypothetical protein